MTCLIAIGDTHIRQDARNELRLRSLDQIVAEVRAMRGIGAILWPGDLFHSKSTIADRNQLAERMLQLGDIAPIVICRGNHDEIGDLDIFARLRTAHPIDVVDRAACISIRLATGQNATLAVLAYPARGGLVSLNVAHGDQVQTADEMFDAIFMSFAHELEAARGRGDLTAFIGHVNIAGSVLSSGQPSIGQELEIRQTHLDRLGPILKIVNHIHLPQEIAGAVYPGSIAPMDWGETHSCRFVVVDVRDSFDFDVQSCRLDTPPMFLVEGKLTRDGFTLFDEHTDAPLFPSLTDEAARRFAQQDWAGCEVKVQYAYLASERPLLDEGVIRTLFASARVLKIVSHVIPDREVRSAAVATAKTLAAKLAAMRPEGVLPATVADKVAALEQQDREMVLAQVRAWVTAIEAGEPAEVAA